MKEAYRVIDANLNRAREGLRVLEEIARFILEDPDLSSRMKDMRHRLSATAGILPGGMDELLKARDPEGDVGAGSWAPGEKTRDGMLSLATANIKRVQEAARVLEEFGKLLAPDIKDFKEIRFESYRIEQELFNRLPARFRRPENNAGPGTSCP